MPRQDSFMEGGEQKANTQPSPGLQRSADAARDTWVEGLRDSLEPRPGGTRGGILLRTDPRGVGELIDLPASRLRLGRGWEVEARVEDDTVSRAHAEVTADRGHYFITDLNSSNGTYVDGQRIESTALHNGSRVRLGKAVTYRFAVVEDDERQALKLLRERGQYDPLTQVHNRRFMTGYLQSELAFAQRHETALSAILLDIDHFKRVNDHHGHLVGDRVLRRVAEIAKAQVRTEDMIARFGGEEFAVVVRQTSVEGAACLADRIARAVEREQFILDDGGVLTVTVSAGCASLKCCSERSEESLIGLADKRLYDAKRQGRNRVVSSTMPSHIGPLAAPRMGSAPVRVAATAITSRPPSRRAVQVRNTAQAFEQLSVNQQRVLGLYFQEQCSLVEIAQVIGEPTAVVEQTFQDALRSVRQRARQVGAA